MLYTSYLDNLERLPEDAIKVVVCRDIKFTINIKLYRNTFHLIGLAPSHYIDNKYKSDRNWGDFVKAYYEEARVMRPFIEIVTDFLNKGRDVYLVGNKIDHTRCHRTLLAEIFKSIGYDYNEYVA